MYFQNKAHPITVFLYFLSVTVVSVITVSPVLAVIFLFGGLLYGATVFGVPKILKDLLVSIPIMIIVTLSNFIFVHKGKTVLFRFNHNAYTLEAIIYGSVMAISLVSLFFWCRSIGRALTGDKISALFGRILPKFSLLLMMTFRSFALLSRQYLEISDAQKTSGITFAGKLSRIKSLLSVFSALTTLSLESAIGSADSMKARGYGLPGRSHFEIYVFSPTDIVLTFITLVTSGISLFIIISGKYSVVFYPEFSGTDLSFPTILLYISALILSLLPTLTETEDRIKWHFLKSRI